MASQLAACLSPALHDGHSARVEADGARLAALAVHHPDGAKAAGSNPATPTRKPQVTHYPVTCGRWSYYSIQQASQQLAGLLSSLEEAEQIIGPRGPKLSAASLHPWIWNAAVSL